MSDDNLFDFENEDDVSIAEEAAILSEKVDSIEDTSDTKQEIAQKPAVQKKAAKRKPAVKSAKTGKTTGKTTGSVVRQKRVPMHQRQPLNLVDKDNRFEYRIVNDTPGRVARLELAGWIVDEDTTIGDPIAGRASALGSASSVPFGRGQTGVVMKIPKELYAEDQAAKQLEVDRAEKAMFADAEETSKKESVQVHGQIQSN